MRAYHNDPKVKAKYVNRMKRHIEADEIRQGIGYEIENSTTAIRNNLPVVIVNNNKIKDRGNY